MVKVQVGKLNYYLDGYLKSNLDLMKEAVTKRDFDCVFVIDGYEGSGKCQPKGSKVLMADGSWKNVEEIKIGDKVLSPQLDGTHIFATVDNTFKYPHSQIYDVHEVHRQKRKLYSCNAEHLIPMNVAVYPRKKGTIRSHNKKWVVKNYSAKDYAALSEHSNLNNTTFTSFPIQSFMGRENCGIEPYCLGVWLGDGHFSSKKIKAKYPPGLKHKVSAHTATRNGKTFKVPEHTAKYRFKNRKGVWKHRQVGITNTSTQIMDEVLKFYPINSIANKQKTHANTYRFSVIGKFAKQLSHYGLEALGSGTKLIPKEALLSDINYRKRLLAGLIDSDGYYRNGGYSITTKSEQLAKDIIKLVYSLGGRGRIKKIKKGIKKTGFVGEYFRASFYIGKLELPIKQKHKINNAYPSCFYLSPNRTSINVRKRDSHFETTYGFEIDSPSELYITDNWCVTHNSTLAMQICMYLDPTFKLDRICFDGKAFIAACKKAKPFTAILYDEAIAGLSSRRALSNINTSIQRVLAQLRQKNLFICIVIPSFFDLDKTAALWRTRFLIHVYFGDRLQRGYFTLYNMKKKLQLWVYGKKFYRYRTAPNFKGKFVKTPVLNDRLYRKMKLEAIEKSSEEVQRGHHKWHMQRDALLYALNKKERYPARQLAAFINEDSEYPMTRQAITHAISTYKQKAKSI